MTAGQAHSLVSDVGVDSARSGPVILNCEEQGPLQVDIKRLLDSNGRLRLNPEIENGDFFTVTFKSGQLTLRARGYVGYVPLNERIVVRIKPRVPIANLSRMARIAGRPPTVLTSIRDYTTGDRWNDSLVNLYATALIQHIETIMLGGLLRDYCRRESTSSFPHGRILIHPTIQNLRSKGIRHAAHVAWYERSSDNASNRCLRYAVWLLAQYFIERTTTDTQSRGLHRKLNAIFSIFDGVELDHSHGFLRDPTITGARPLPTLRSYYRDALNVAVAIVEQRAVLIDGTEGKLRLPSLVLNMNDVFEAYVRQVLMLHAMTDRWNTLVLDGNLEGRKMLFDSGPSPEATPDVVLRDPDGSTPLILEIKNVPAGWTSTREAINQAVTYAVSYGSRRVMLVHPRGGATYPVGLHKMGSVGGVEVFQYQIDLSAADLSAEDSKFVRLVGSLLPLVTS